LANGRIRGCFGAALLTAPHFAEYAAKVNLLDDRRMLTAD